MAFPESARLEVPILQELLATGGEEKVKFLYQRLIPYFPQLTEKDLRVRTKTRKNQWKALVQRTGERLVKKGELKRSRGRWVLTESGRQHAEAEKMLWDPPPSSLQVANRAVPHSAIQIMLVEIGRMPGKYAEKEYQRYDVVWKESELSPRLSHVFEVQVKGKTNNYLASFVIEGGCAGVAYVDVTTSEFATTELAVEPAVEELARLRPSELLPPQSLSQNTQSNPGVTALASGNL